MISSDGLGGGGCEEDGRWRSLHLDIATPAPPYGLPASCEMDADAAAGGPAASDSDHSTRGGCFDGRASSPLDLSLAVQATGGSLIASASAVQLERELGDAAVLQSHAAAAIDRIAKQQAALRRFPMACPSCGTLNAPQGLAWGVGDIVACQGCRQSFVPLGHGMQDSDLKILRVAVQQLRIYAERVQYLEQIVRNSSSAKLHEAPSPSTSGQARSVAGPSRSPSKRMASAAANSRGHLQIPSSGTPGPALISKGSPMISIRREAKDERTLSPASVGSHDEGARLSHGSSTPSPLTANADRIPGGARDPGRPIDEPQLMSLMDSRDLMTNSSSASEPQIFIQGRRLRHRQTDTDQQAMEALQRARHNVGSTSSRAGFPGSRRVDREEGEITSASEDDRSGAESWKVGKSCQAPSPSRQSPLAETLAALRAANEGCMDAGQVQRRGTPSPASKAKVDDKASPSTAQIQTEAAEIFDDIDLRVAWQLFVVYGSFLILRFMLDTLAEIYASIFSFGPAFMASLSAGCALGMVKFAHSELDNSRLLVTAPIDQFKRAVALRVRGVHWELFEIDFTVEETFGVACALAQLMLFSCFENWGRHIPSPYQSTVVFFHALTIVSLTLAERRYFTRILELPAESSDSLPKSVSRAGLAGSCSSSSSLWLSLVASNWVAVTVASMTWWRAASLASWSHPCSSNACPAVPTAPTYNGRLPVLASAAVHVVNFWIARRAQQSTLLMAYVALAGVSMAVCCYQSHGDSSSLEAQWVDAASEARAAFSSWMPELYMIFCAMGAWVVWQELDRSL